MLRGGQNQNAKRQHVERVRAKSGFLNNVFKLRRASKDRHTTTNEENSHPDRAASAATAKSIAHLLSDGGSWRL